MTKRPEPEREPDSHAAAPAPSTRRILILATLFVIPSGAAALINQVVWVRLLGLSIGAASASVATVIAAFFLGLAIGSALAPRLLERFRDPLLVYLALEAAIALCALLLLPALLNLDSLVAAIPALSDWGPMRFALALLLLAPPTICMGATYPVVVSWAVRRDESVGEGLSLVYAANTAGAVVGACGSGFVLIPWIGLAGAVGVAVLLNLSIVAVGFAARRSLPVFELPVASREAEPSAAAEGTADAARAPQRIAALWILAGTGFGSVASEVGWTHVLSILTGTTIYGFSAILTAYLIGIATGSFAMRGRAAALANPAPVLGVGLVVLALALVATRAVFASLPAVFASIEALEYGARASLALRMTVAGGMILLPTFLYGALFPLSLKLYCGTRAELQAGVGRAYAVNTLAGIAGSLFAAFVAIPHLGTNTLLTSVALLTALLAVPLLPGLDVPRRRQLLAGLVACALAAALAPRVDWKTLLASVQYDEDIRAGLKPTYLFLEEGHSGVVSVVTFDEGKHAKLMNGGLNESFICLEDPDHEIWTESLLGLVPWLWHERPKNAFVIGLGGGVTARALARTDLEEIRVVELEREVVAALSALGEAGERVRYESRIDLRVDDARHQLLVSDRNWDLIVSQPSHPWKSGASNLFTHDFFRLVESRLGQGGIFGQWINLFRMDATTLQSLLATFFDVFEHGFVFINVDGGDLLVFGSQSPMEFDDARMRERIGRPAVARLLDHGHVETPADLLGWFALSRAEALAMSDGARLVTDLNILPEVRLAATAQWVEGEQNPQRLVLRHRGFDLSEFFAGPELARRLETLGSRLLDAEDEAGARRIVGVLERRAPGLAARLQRRIRIAYPNDDL